MSDEYTAGLHGHEMHDLVMRSLEIGELAARAEDDEACGYGPLFDAQYEAWERENG